MNSILQFFKNFGPESYTIYCASHSFSAWNSSVIVQCAFSISYAVSRRATFLYLLYFINLDAWYIELIWKIFREIILHNDSIVKNSKMFARFARIFCSNQKVPEFSAENFVKSTDLVLNHLVNHFDDFFFFQIRLNFSYFSTIYIFKSFSTLGCVDSVVNS